MNEVTIKSADTAAKLIFSNIEGDYFTASFESPELRTSRRVWGYTDCEFLVNLFEYMAKEWKGWEGEQTWTSIEGEFGLSCSSDRQGHVRIKLFFVQFEGMEPWKAEPTLNLEAGLMDEIAKNMRKFFLG